MRTLVAVVAVLVAQLAAAAVPLTQITGNVLDPSGTAPTSGTVTCSLSQPGSALDGATSQRVAMQTTTTLGTGGAVSFSLVPNDAITPSGTAYTCRYSVATANGTRSTWAETWQLASSPSPINIGAVPRVGVLPGNQALALPAATGATPGMLQLANDLGGTSPAPTVVATHLSAPLPQTQGGSGAAALGGGTVTASGSSTATKALRDWASDILAASPSLSLPFASPGCYAIGSALGARGEAAFTTRASTKTCNASGGLSSCSANALCIEAQGALVEPAATNLLTAPEDFTNAAWVKSAASVVPNAVLGPNGSTVAALLREDGTTASHFLMQGPSLSASTRYIKAVYAKSAGRGFVKLQMRSLDGVFRSAIFDLSLCAVSSQNGSAAADAKPAENGFCRVWMAVDSGTGVSSNNEVIYSCNDGSSCAAYAGDGASGLYLWGAETKAAPHQSSYSAGSRAADALTAPWPTGIVDNWSVDLTVSPEYGRAWNALDATLWSAGTSAAANSARCRALAAGTISCDVYDGSAAVKTLAYTHAFAAGSSHQVTFGASAGTLSLYVDKTPVSGSTSGAGTGQWTAAPATFLLGALSTAGTEAAAYLYAPKVCRGAGSVACYGPSSPPPVRTLWLADSIYNDAHLWTPTNGGTDPYVANDTGTYGGTVIGTGLLELADATSYWNGSMWASAARGTAFSAYGALVFEYGRNDANNSEPVAAYRRAYDKILAQGVKYFPRVVSGNCPPKTDPNQLAWDFTDAFYTGGYKDVLPPLVAKYGPQHIDTWQQFQDLVTAGTYTVTQLMRDLWHPTYTTGLSVIAGWIASGYNHAPGLITGATPEVSGRVVNHLFGQQSAGAWTQTTGLVSSTGPTQSPLFRIAGLSDQANVASASAAIVTFPPLTCSVGNCQVWAHFLVDSSTGGTVTIYVDKGAGGQVATTYNTLQSGVSLYTRSVLAADGLGAGSHAVEIDTTSSGPVRVVGVTYVGVP